MKKIFFTAALIIISYTTNAQVGIGTTTPHTSSILDLTSTTKGLLIPRMTSSDRDLIKSPALGMIIYNTTTNAIEVKRASNWFNLSAKTTAAATSGVATTTGGVGIGTTSPDKTSILHLVSTTKGLLPPRMAAAPSGTAGLIYYDNTLNALRVHNGTSWNSIN